MANADFPYDLKKRDLADPTLGRFNRAFRYIWEKLQPLIGEGTSTVFLNGSGVYVTPLSPDFPPTHLASGTPGQVAFDAAGAFYFCYAKDRWARINAGGYSNTF